MRWNLVFAPVTVMLLAAATACGEGNTNGQTTADGEGQAEAQTTPAAGPTPGGPAPLIISRTRGGGIITQAAPGVAAQPAVGLTVQHTEKATLPATVAYAMATFVSRVAPVAGGVLPAAETTKLLDGLAAAGFPEAKVQNDGRFGPYAIVQAKVPLNDVAASSRRVFDAIESSAGRPEQTGVQFGLEDCATGLDSLRRAAFKAAEAKAKSAANAGGLTLGQIIATSDAAPLNVYAPGLTSDPCDPLADLQFKGIGNFKAVDSKPEMEVSVSISVTYALAGDVRAADASGLTASGSGRVTAEANEAYVVVLVQPNYGPTGPRPISERDKAEVVAKLKELGVAEADIKFHSSNFGGPLVVSIEMADLARVSRDGDDIGDVIEDVMGAGQGKGVVFTHSRCRDVEDEARKEALADARAKAERLAAVTGVKLGKPRSVSDAGAQANPYGGAAIDPCSEDLSTLAFNPYGGAGSLKAFDAKPEFEIAASVLITFATE
jgi:uncharacterized protein